MSQIKQTNRIDWQTILLGIGLLLLIGASYAYFRNKKANQKQPSPISDEVLYKQEEPTRESEEKEQMSEEEKRKIKDQIKSMLGSVEAEQANIYQVDNSSLKGVAKRLFSDGKFYFYVNLNNLPFPQKGYYYEAWLERDINDFISLGRVEILEDGGGELYYLTTGDKSSYKTVKISLEPEDGNPEQSETLFSGIFK